MTKEELRIGQTYMSVKFKTPVKLTEEDIYELVHKAEGADISHYIDEMFEPIPLTEELLWDLGFVCDEDTEIFELGDVTIDIHGDKFVFAVQGTEECSHETRYFAHHTKYVHQIQNLFYAITGKELVLAATPK